MVILSIAALALAAIKTALTFDTKKRKLFQLAEEGKLPQKKPKKKVKPKAKAKPKAKDKIARGRLVGASRCWCAVVPLPNSRPSARS